MELDTLWDPSLTPLPAKAGRFSLLVLSAGLGDCCVQFHQVSTSFFLEGRFPTPGVSLVGATHVYKHAERIMWLATETFLNLLNATDTFGWYVQLQNLDIYSLDTLYFKVFVVS